MEYYIGMEALRVGLLAVVYLQRTQHSALVEDGAVRVGVPGGGGSLHLLAVVRL